MKTLLSVLSIVLSIFLCVASANASPNNYDGCFQLATQGAMYPVVCMQGTTEEGIGGSNARLAIFHTNTDRVIHCAKSTELMIRGGRAINRMEFIIDGTRELIFNNVVENRGLKSGDAILGSTNLKFFEIGAEHTARFQKIASESCADQW